MGGKEADEEFRGGSAEGDDGKTDDHGPDPVVQGDGGRSGYQPFRADEQKKKADEQKDKIDDHTHSHYESSTLSALEINVFHRYVPRDHPACKEFKGLGNNKKPQKAS
ncbi:hypothetical protein JCM14469_03670 [Desulfatiferula olefinivorans]